MTNGIVHEKVASFAYTHNKGRQLASGR